MKSIHNHRLDVLKRSTYCRGLMIIADITRIHSLVPVVGGLYCLSECCRLDLIDDIHADFLCMFVPQSQNRLLAELCPQSSKEAGVAGLKSRAEKDLVYGGRGIKGAAVQQDTA